MMKQKMMWLQITVALLIAIFCSTTVPSAANDESVQVQYVYANGNSMGTVTAQTLRPDNDQKTISGGWYAVTEDVTYNEYVILTGDVNLILCDGKTLTASKGIEVKQEARLTIWAQSTGDKMGKLIARSGTEGSDPKPSQRAAIGGGSDETAGSIIINGGIIDANADGSRSAGIGAGEGESASYTHIEINGGNVTAIGNRAGIGTGELNKKAGSIFINGGTVIAEGYYNHPGIGGPLWLTEQAEVTITGGKVTCQGKGAGISGGIVTIDGNEEAGDYVNAEGLKGTAGITGNTIIINGSKVTATGSNHGAGIGGSNEHDGGKITINGGNITATGMQGGAGIGGGYKGDSGTITITGGTVNANCSGTYNFGAGIGSGYEGICQDVTISGGTISASGGTKGGSGIGGSFMGDLTGTITISGGEVNAFGNGGGAGIGSGYQANALKGTVTITGGKVCAISTSKAAGIGGGCEGMFEVGGEGANVSISGNADVIAWSGGGKSSAIGHGDNDREYGTLTIAPGMSVKAGWSDTEAEKADPFPSDERVNACQYRWFAHIKPCDHPSREFSITDTQHFWQCKYCGDGVDGENHKMDGENRCTVCGYQGTIYTVTFDANGGTGIMAAMTAVPGKGIPLPGCGFTPPQGMAFDHWEADDGRTYYKGDSLDPAKDTVVKAFYRAATAYDLWVNGVQVNSANQGSLLDGMAVYEGDKTSGTLTLKRGAQISGAYQGAGIFSKIGALTIVTEDDCAVDADSGYGIQAGGSLTISGGSLTVKGKACGIQSEGALTLTGADVTASGEGDSGIRTANGAALTIVSSVVTASSGGSAPGIEAAGELSITGDGTIVTAKADRSHAITAAGGITIDQNLAVAMPAGGSVAASGGFIADAGGNGNVHHVVIRKAEPYPVYVGNVQVTSANAMDILGDGSAQYDPGTRTLLFRKSPNLASASSAALIRTENQDLTIVAPGDGLTLSGGKVSTGVLVEGNLTIDGNVRVTAKNETIHANGGIRSLGSLYAEAANGSETDSMIYAKGDIYIGGDLTALSMKGMGLFSAQGSVEIVGSARLAAMKGTLLKAKGNIIVHGNVSTQVRTSSATVVQSSTATGFDAGDTIQVVGGVWEIRTSTGGTAMRAKNIDIPGTHEIKKPEGGGLAPAGNYGAVIVDDKGKPASHALIMEKEQTPVTFPVTFDTGETGWEVSVVSGMTVERPEDPVRDGYTFLSWVNKKDHSDYDFSSPVTEALNLTATWYRSKETTPEDRTWVYDEADASKRTLTADSGADSYQWYTVAEGKSSAISGAMGSSYTLPSSTQAGEHTVLCRAVKTEGEVTTANSYLFRVTVSKADPVAVVEENKGLRYTGNSLRLLGSAVTTGGTLLYSLDNQNWSKAIPTARNADTYMVYFKVEGDENHNDVPVESVSVTIGKRKLTVYPMEQTKTYGEADPEFTFTQTGLLSGDRLVGALGREDRSENAGRYTISQGTLEVEGENKNNYGLKVNPGTLLTIQPASISDAVVTLAESSLSHTGSSQTVTVRSVKLGEKTLTPDDYEISGDTGTNIGNYTVTVTGKGNYTDTATAYWSIALTVPTIATEPDASAITYGQSLNDSTLTGGKAEAAGSVVAGTFSWKRPEIKPAVSDSEKTEYAVVFTPENGNYAVVEFRIGLTVNKADVSLTPPVAKTDLVYTGSAQQLVSAGSVKGGTLYYAVTTEQAAPADANAYATAIPRKNDTGTYYVWYKVVGDDNHSDTTPASVTVTIGSKAMTVSAADVTATVDGQPHGVTVNVTDPATGYTVKYGTEAGNYTLDASPTQTEAGTKTVYYQVTADNYTTYTGSAKVTISAKQTQTITASDVTVTYSDTDKKVTAATDGNGAISYAVKEGSGDYIEVDASTGALTIKKVPADGKAYVTVTAAGTATYEQATKDVTVTINKANAVAATVTANSRTYDGTEKPLVTVTGEPTGGEMQYAPGTATEATQPYTTSIPAKTEAGTYYVWYMVKGDSDHTDSAPAPVIVTIAEKQTEAPTDPATPEETEAPVKETPDNPIDEAAPAKIQANASIQLNADFLVYWKGSTVFVKWGKTPEADQFEIYAQYCGRKTCKKIMTVKSGNSVSFKRLNGKKLNRKRNVKVYVVASKNGKEIGRTLLGHAAGSKNSHTNAKKVKVSKKSYTLAVGKSAKIKAKIVKAKSGKKLPGKGHCAKLRYTSSNTKVATVSKSGKIKAVGKGKCDIRIFAQNGRSCKVTVTVK